MQSEIPNFEILKMEELANAMCPQNAECTVSLICMPTSTSLIREYGVRVIREVMWNRPIAHKEPATEPFFQVMVIGMPC